MEFSDDFISLLTDIKNDKPLILDYLFDPAIQITPDSESFEDFINQLKQTNQSDSPSLLRHEIEIINNFNTINNILPIRESSINESLQNDYTTIKNLHKNPQPMRIEPPSISEINQSLQPTYKPLKPSLNQILKNFIAQDKIFQEFQPSPGQISPYLTLLVKTNFVKLQKFSAKIFIQNRKIDVKSTKFKDLLKSDLGVENEFLIEIINRVGAEIDCKKLAERIIVIGNEKFGKNGEKWTGKLKLKPNSNLSQKVIKLVCQAKVGKVSEIDAKKAEINQKERELDSEILKLQNEISQLETKQKVKQSAVSETRVVEKTGRLEVAEPLSMSKFMKKIAPDSIYFSETERKVRKVKFSEQIEGITY